MLEDLISEERKIRGENIKQEQILENIEKANKIRNNIHTITIHYSEMTNNRSVSRRASAIGDKIDPRPQMGVIHYNAMYS